MPAPEILRIVFGFIAVLAMIGGSAFLARKAGLSNLAGIAGNKRRLSIIESLPLDSRRRLSIVRCDDLEYLLVLGPSGETVVASGLESAPAAEHSDAPVLANPFADLSGIAQKLRAKSAAFSKKDAA